MTTEEKIAKEEQELEKGISVLKDLYFESLRYQKEGTYDKEKYDVAPYRDFMEIIPKDNPIGAYAYHDITNRAFSFVVSGGQSFANNMEEFAEHIVNREVFRENYAELTYGNASKNERKNARENEGR